MTETKDRYGKKRIIHLSKEQEERMAAQSAQKIQAFVNEAAQVQSRRCEVLVALVASQTTFGGHASVDLPKLQELANATVRADSLQKFSDLKILFAELGVHGPQPHLEWAAAQVGVTLFDAPAEEETPALVQTATTADLAKVIQ